MVSVVRVMVNVFLKWDGPRDDLVWEEEKG